MFWKKRESNPSSTAANTAAKADQSSRNPPQSIDPADYRALEVKATEQETTIAQLQLDLVTLQEHHTRHLTNHKQQAQTDQERCSELLQQANLQAQQTQDLQAQVVDLTAQVYRYANDPANPVNLRAELQQQVQKNQELQQRLVQAERFAAIGESQVNRWRNRYYPR
jgi:hypothetical protein